MRHRKLDAPYRLTPHPCGGPARLDPSLKLNQGDPPYESPAWPRRAAGSDHFWLLELRVSRTFLDQLRPQLFTGHGYPTQCAANTSRPGSDRFRLLELRVSRTFLDQLRPQLSGSVGLLACPLFAAIHGVIIRKLLGRAALGIGIDKCPVLVPSQCWRVLSSMSSRWKPHPFTG